MGIQTQNRLLNYKLQRLIEVGQAFHSVIEINRLIRLIADRTADILEADRCSIFVFSKKGNCLWTMAATGTTRIEVDAKSGIVGAVAQTGETIHVEDAYKDPRFNPEIDRRTGYRTQGILCGPMFNSDHAIIGVFQLLNSKNGVFRSEDFEILQALSGFAGNAVENSLLYEELKTTFHSVVEVLGASVDAKHPYTAGHTERVSQYTLSIARHHGLSREEIEVIRVAAYLHDYGKIGIPDAILMKPGKLTTEEFSVMRSHAAKTSEILSRMQFRGPFSAVPAIASSHHEKWDGRGYPHGLKGKEIPLGGRIMAYADVFDALTSKREYREPMTWKEAFEHVRGEVGTSFDPTLFPAFRAFFKELTA